MSSRKTSENEREILYSVKQERRRKRGKKHRMGEEEGTDDN